MKSQSLLLMIGALALLGGCGRPGNEPAAAPHEGEAEKHSRVRHTPEGAVIVAVDAPTQKLIGLQTVPLPPFQLSPELKGYGRVLDVTSLVTSVADLTIAQAVSEASQAELKRLKALALQNNASERALQAAETAAIRDRTQGETSRLRLLATWGIAISERKDLALLAENLSSLKSALVEIRIPSGERLKNAPVGARLLPLDAEASPVDAQYLGPAPTVSSMQDAGYFFLVQSNRSGLVPGAAITGLLTLPATPRDGVLLPKESIVYLNGDPWVYVQTSEEAFQRTAVGLSSMVENGWFVEDGLKPQDKVVTLGAQQLLSEELKGQDIE